MLMKLQQPQRNTKTCVVAIHMGGTLETGEWDETPAAHPYTENPQTLPRHENNFEYCCLIYMSPRDFFS